MNREELLKSITFQLDRAQKSYDNYVRNKFYLHAKCIYNSNMELYSLINSYSFLFNIEEREIAIEFLIHIDVWKEQFHNLMEKTNPELDSLFVFERFEGIPEFPKKIKEIFVK